ncbi:hybrid sensor histidine kinase/response regulator [Chlorogloeopsis sp. ULAP01]|uniref:hybrid sensor histidine kinase/response regulator n=1 Tax=Chlorogloeopsis sp. ULAP01 TaxID=3056483 RepID=UPI0025AA3D61|nr:hybrid sensor histidine kinase/response regulator [Chlorogloeopsis sp. ULAP01]MDM9384289.1 hybrid sensor histidine kinase/response regulator [Chlorogloeopsis sp. ULAP01]
MNKELDFSNFSLLDLFSMEVKAQVAAMNNSLLALERNPHPKAELAALMRAAHSIKGAARIVQMDNVVSLVHTMEDCFAAAQAGKICLNPDAIDVFLQGADMLLHIAEVCITNPNIDRELQIQSLIAEITQLQTHEVVPLLSSQILNVPDSSVTDIYPLPTTDLVTQLPPAANEIPQSSHSLSAPTTTEELRTNYNSVMRVSTDNLNHLMALAGESLVEANWLEPFANSLLQLKGSQTELSGLLEKLEVLLSQQGINSHVKEILSLARQKASECRQILGDRQNELELFSQRSVNLADHLYRQVVTTRMCQFEEGGQGFPRMVRDVAKKLGKQVNLEIIGKSTLLDRDILERLEAPLTQILRNAIDHGIESPQERLAAGKKEVGTIRVEVLHRAGMLFIAVSDDGRGIEPEILRQEIVNKQLTNAEMAVQLSEAELMEFLFLPGFSTAKNVTEISGRGVGLDIAYSTVRQLGGIMRAISSVGNGMTFSLQLPLTLSVIRTLLVEIANEPYAFGLTHIERVVVLSRSDIQLSENQPFFMLNHQPVQLISAHQVLELPSSPTHSEWLSAIILSDRQSIYGLVIDRFLGERNLVVRPLNPRLGKVPNISAASLMDDGSPVLIVDVEDLVRSIAKVLSTKQINQVNQSHHQAITTTYKRILVVDDSITVREMERKLLENKGYKVEVAVNGIDAWNTVRSGDYDLVVTDIDMPRMNGFELTSQIKTHANLKHTPVIIVSYKDREEDRLQGLEVGADYYLTKSHFHDNRLVQAVIDLIGEA